MIWTDVVQFFLYLTGSVAAFFLLLHKIPGGWPEVTQVAAASGGKLRVFDFAFSLTQSYTFWSGLLGGTFLTMASHGTDQTMVQRLLAQRQAFGARECLDNLVTRLHFQAIEARPLFSIRDNSFKEGPAGCFSPRSH